MTENTITSNAQSSKWFSGLKLLWKDTRPLIRDFFVHIIGQFRILQKIYPGIMHFLLFWGVTLQIIGTMINLLQMQLFLPFVELTEFPRGVVYLYYELLMDIAGVMILLGVGMAAFRRWIMRPATLQTRWDDVYALILLALIPLAGYTLEGLRLTAASPVWESWSPIGHLFARLFRGLGLTPDAASEAHIFLFWTHVTLGLLFIGSIPFTKLRHLIMTPLNILSRPDRKPGVLNLIENIEETELLGVGQIAEFKPQQLLSFDACLNCGRCETNCPVALSGMDFSPRRFTQTLRETAYSSLIVGNGNGHHMDQDIFSPESAPWFCTTCGACLDQCPAFVNPVDQIIDLRRYQVLTTGKVPKMVSDVFRNLERQGNPWGMLPEDRLAWADGLEIRELAPGDTADVLVFLGCAAAFDQRNRNVTRAFIQILKSLDIDFGILGYDEMCCGETARRMGHEYLFQVFAEQNIERLSQIHFNKIVTQCPHCFNTLINEYPQLGGNFKVQHHTEYLAELDLPWTATNDHIGMITYHDPCYLGRYNQTFDPPRRLLDQAGLHRVEMNRNGRNSFCCGGGGGQMWMETDPDKRINQKRLNDVLSAGAEAVATACPYCLLMFDDAIRSSGIGKTVQVLDITEILASRIPKQDKEVAA